MHFPVTKGVLQRQVGAVRAVDGVSFSIKHGETLGVAGESGCGKTTMGRLILRLIEATAGEVYFQQSPNLLQLKPSAFQPYRQLMQMIFQDPFSSLNPRMTIESVLAEPLQVFALAKTRRAAREQCADALTRVGLNADALSRYPHEFSGGQRQRIGIARALIVQPRLIIADEAVSALDVSIQAQILNLLIDLRERMGLSYVFIAHDLSVVRHISHHVAIMYLGEIVELAPTDKLFDNPLHPYTQLLFEAVPTGTPGKRRRQLLQGDVPSPHNPPPGCRFHTRCPKVMDVCRVKAPANTVRDGDHRVACHLYE